MLDTNFYKTNKKFKELHDKLDSKDWGLLTDVVGEAIQHGIKVLAESLNIK